jgi:hypothetical protein
MNPLDRVIAISQVFALAAWEALGVFGFGWNGWAIAAVWFVSLWTFNILVATGTRTFFKLMEPPVDSVTRTGLQAVPDITEDDGVH